MCFSGCFCWKIPQMFLWFSAVGWSSLPTATRQAARARPVSGRAEGFLRHALDGEMVKRKAPTFGAWGVGGFCASWLFCFSDEFLLGLTN